MTEICVKGVAFRALDSTQGVDNPITRIHSREKAFTRHLEMPKNLRNAPDCCVPHGGCGIYPPDPFFSTIFVL
jgi:hypothetical protein